MPTSYIVCQTKFDFFGGYDHKAGGGFVHVADRNIAPGKKQWTWGNHEFGWSWDRELTDANGPYVELMAGVYTDNQPDFSYLAPYETKTFSQFWWPIQDIGPVQQANQRAALRMVVREDRKVELGLCVSEVLDNGLMTILCGGEVLMEKMFSLAPGDSWTDSSLKFQGANPAELTAVVTDGNDEQVLVYRPVDESSITREREVATEPPTPAGIPSADELYFTGEAHYFLGLALFFQGRLDEAYAYLSKATWNHAWRSAARYQLACIDCRKLDFDTALENLTESVACNGDHHKAQVLMAVVLRHEGEDEALSILGEILEVDPLDHWARHEMVLGGEMTEHEFLKTCRNDAQTILDLVFDYADAGFRAKASDFLMVHLESEVEPVAVPNPLSRAVASRYVLAWLKQDVALLQEAREPDPADSRLVSEYDQLCAKLNHPPATRLARCNISPGRWTRRRVWARPTTSCRRRRMSTIGAGGP